MTDSVFGEVSFEGTWHKKEKISYYYCGKTYQILACIIAHKETDPITDEQRQDYSAFKKNQHAIEQEVESLLIAFRDDNPSFVSSDLLELLTPAYLDFERRGGYAVLFDDASDPDEGIVVVLAPEKDVTYQSLYL